MGINEETVHEEDVEMARWLAVVDKHGVVTLCPSMKKCKVELKRLKQLHKRTKTMPKLRIKYVKYEI